MQMFRLRARSKQPTVLGVAFALCLVPLSVFLATLSSAQAGPTSGVLNLAQTDGLVRVEPAVTTVENGETFRIDIWIDNAEDLGGFQFILNYDPALIEVPKQTDPMILGDLIGSTGRTPMEVVNELDPVAGTISYAVITTGSSPGANGEGLLAFVELRARALGSSPLDLADVEIADTGGRQQTVSIGNGLVIVAASPNPDQVTMDKAVNSPTVLPGGVLSYTLDRSLSLAGGHTFEEIVYDPIPSGTLYLDGSATLNGIPAPELYSETLDAIYYQNSGSFTDNDQWTIDFQVEVGALPNGTVVVNTVTETVRFDGASYTGPYIGTAESTVFNNPPNEPGDPSPPDGATGVSIDADLSWTGGDPDAGQPVTYDVYFAAGDPAPDVLICDDTPTPACDPGTLAYGTQYYWYVVATDDQGASTTGPTWDFTTNNLPNTPGSPSPPDGATGVSIDADLSWTGGDPDPGQTVTYDVYFAAGDPTPDVLICDDAPTATCDPGTLSNSTQYYWYVIATDSLGTSATGNTWDFATNNPPNTPGSPSPPDGATGVTLDADLSWTGGDPDAGQPVTYDVYFAAGDPTPDVLICDDTPTPACDPGTLAYSTQYYWYVVATDEQDASTTGPTWDFETGTEPNRPPYPPGDPLPEDGATDLPITADLSWTGGDPDPGDTVTYDVYFEAGDPTPDILICNDTPTPACDPGTLTNGMHYYWYVVATDSHSASTAGPTWDFTTVCPPPGTPILVAPADGSTTEDTTPRFGWSPVSTATSYRIQVDDNGDFASPELDTTTSTPGYTPTSPLSLGTQYWHVQAVNPCGNSAWSPSWTLRIVTKIYLPIMLRNASNE